MKRFFCFFALIFFPLVAKAEIQLIGQIYKADGKAPGISHGHLTNISFSHQFNPIVSVQANKEGEFILRLPESGLYRLWISAPNHLRIAIPLVVKEEDKVVNLEITLAPNLLKESLDEVQIIGDWNDFDIAKAEPMQKMSDGTFVYEREVSKETVAYQLVGIDKWSTDINLPYSITSLYNYVTGINISNRSLNGTMSDYYIYDENGNYRSILRVKPGKVKIVFYPQEISRTSATNLPKLSYDEGHQYLEKFFEISQEYNKMIWKHRQAAEAYIRKHETLEGFTFPASDCRKFLKKVMQEEDTRGTREFAAVHLAALAWFEGVGVDSTEHKRILEIAPPTSPFWGIDPYLPPSVAKTQVEGRNESIISEFLNKNPNRLVRAFALSHLIEKAALEGDKQRTQELYKELNANYSDVKEVEFTLKRFDPNRKILVGKPVPDFELKLIGSEERVSNKSLLGKYYLIDFWAVWCAPCVAEMPLLHGVYGKFRNFNFEILSLSLDASVEDVEKFRTKKKWKMPWLNAFVKGGFQNKIVQNFDVLGIPKPILVNPDGIIVATEEELRGENLEKTLAKYLGDVAGRTSRN